ncbi:MAG: ATP-dependent helicase [Clostridioides sp.]|jgi:DNA helicase-2/ATP-dependent DNA helicase PcrA|nr:ATP-dependent helicase [Clostridioides sp.]
MAVNLTEGLNENQKKAVAHVDGPCLVVAGPGSGKTRTISHRIANLVINKGINPRSILAISFTKASSQEMKKRTLSITADSRIRRVNFGTFHSVFFKILRYFSGYELNSLIDEKVKLKAVSTIMKSLGLKEADDGEMLGRVITEISYVKNELMHPRDFDSELFDKSVFESIYNKYEMFKHEIKKIDFDDMLIMTYELLRANKRALDTVRMSYKYVLVDEFQDINNVQFEVIKLITLPENNLFVVGDEDQSIYGFRGSRPDFLLEFEKYFEGSNRIVLDINYRSNSEIITAGNNLIGHNVNRYDKSIKPYLGMGGRVAFIEPKDSEEEANYIVNDINKKVSSGEAEFSDFAIIYRNNIQSRAFIDTLIDMRIDFSVKDIQVGIYDHWACRDLISYLKIASEVSTNDDWVRIINRPFRYLSREAISKAKSSNDFLYSLTTDCDLKQIQIETVEDLDADLHYVKGLAPSYAISYIRSTLDYDRYILDYCNDKKLRVKDLTDILNEFESSSKKYKTIPEFLEHIKSVKKELAAKRVVKDADRGVVLTTMHSAKGLEFRHVYIIGVDEKTIPYQGEKGTEMSESHVEEERRLFYVAITRAKESLLISSPHYKFGKLVEESIFISETKKKKVEKLKLNEDKS